MKSSDNPTKSKKNRKFKLVSIPSLAKKIVLILIVSALFTLGTFTILKIFPHSYGFLDGRSSTGLDISVPPQSNQLVPVTEAIPIQTPNTPQISEVESDQSDDETFSKITSMQEVIEYRLQSNEDAHSYLNDRMAALEKNLNYILDEMMQNPSVTRKQMQIQLNQLETNLKLYFDRTSVKTDEKQTAETTPPFHLVSVDNWDSDWYAVIKLSGKTAIVAKNESRAGWKLTAIDPSQRRVVFQSLSTKSDVELEITQ